MPEPPVVTPGQGFVVSAGRGIGQGACARACPGEALQLVFGTEKRGVDIPRLDTNFETNVTDTSAI